MIFLQKQGPFLEKTLNFNSLLSSDTQLKYLQIGVENPESAPFSENNNALISFTLDNKNNYVLSEQQDILEFSDLDSSELTITFKNDYYKNPYLIVNVAYEEAD